MIINYSGTSTCIDTDVQLVGGETEREGRVEMCFNGVWGAVCASGWNDIAANIVCKQLGYTSSSELKKCAWCHVGYYHSPSM